MRACASKDAGQTPGGVVPSLGPQCSSSVPIEDSQRPHVPNAHRLPRALLSRPVSASSKHPTLCDTSRGPRRPAEHSDRAGASESGPHLVQSPRQGEAPRRGRHRGREDAGQGLQDRVPVPKHKVPGRPWGERAGLGKLGWWRAMRSGASPASNHKPAEAFQDSHFSSSHADKFPPFDCLTKTLQSTDVWVPSTPSSWPLAHRCSPPSSPALPGPG